MRTSQLLMSILIFSAIASGLSSFFISTAEVYEVDNSQLNTLETNYNQHAVIIEYVKQMQETIQRIDISNPFTWYNIVPFVVNIFLIIINLPATFHTITVSIVTDTLFLPAWTTWLIEGAVLITLVFAIVSTLAKWKV